MIQHKGFTVAPLVVRVFMCELPKEEEQPVEESPSKLERAMMFSFGFLVSVLFWAGIIAAGFGAHWIWKWMFA